MWQSLLKTEGKLTGRRRGGRLICRTLALAAVGAGGLWVAWRARRRASRLIRQRAEKETQSPTAEK